MSVVRFPCDQDADMEAMYFGVSLSHEWILASKSSQTYRRAAAQDARSVRYPTLPLRRRAIPAPSHANDRSPPAQLENNSILAPHPVYSAGRGAHSHGHTDVAGAEVSGK